MDNILGPKLRLEGQIETEKAERSTEDISLKGFISLSFSQ